MQAEPLNACDGIVGISDEGNPLVRATYKCGFFTGQPDALCPMQECWYCKYADFRKSETVKIVISICRHPCNRVTVAAGKQNETVTKSTE